MLRFPSATRDFPDVQACSSLCRVRHSTCRILLIDSQLFQRFLPPLRAGLLRMLAYAQWETLLRREDSVLPGRHVFETLLPAVPLKIPCPVPVGDMGRG